MIVFAVDLIPGIPDLPALAAIGAAAAGAAYAWWRGRPAPPPRRDEEATRPAPAAAPAPSPPPSDWLDRLRSGLSRTRDQLFERVDDLFRGGRKIDEDLLQRLEEVLVTADVGIRTAERLLAAIRDRASREELSDAAAMRRYLGEEASALLAGRDQPLASPPPTGPLVIMVVGVNGTGKTTTIGKLASRYSREGKKVMLAAGDTFRAAAIEQLEIWAQRAGAEIVRQQEGSDPSAVIFDAVKAAVARGFDVLIADTAGRLHTKAPLMDELRKVKRVTDRALPGAPHEVLLVLDASTGQNAVAQARLFDEAVGVTGIVLTKLDGTAKGGVVLQIADQLGLPIKLIGIGEKVEDLRDFRSADFVRALFGDGERPARPAPPAAGQRPTAP